MNPRPPGESDAVHYQRDPSTSREVPPKYDPEEHRTPTNGERRPHQHQRHYDHGLIAPPLSIRYAGRWVGLILVAASLTFFGVILTLGETDNKACEERRALSQTVIHIIERSQPALRQYYTSGVITKEQYDSARANNEQAIEELATTC